ncbi:ATP-binding protein [Spongisporangium articulatum]|uniref:ATP-binding protein n=1 Tax=Spongisporangium articulatum TaxID=3362603 RepID=A0ABW8AIL1_9ACTN
MPEPFAAVLRRLREARALTQEELAERAGLTVKAVGALERGERLRPYPHTVRALADALGADAAERGALVAAVPPRTGGRRPSAAASPAPTVTAGGRTPFLGRDAEAAHLTSLVTGGASGRVVTVTGPGGVGKTRLTTEVTLRLAGAPENPFPGGIVTVELATVREPDDVLPRLASALGVPENRAAPTVSALAPYLTGRRMLLVLDNLEQLLDAAPVIDRLVAACPDLVVLATSRAPLRIRAEHEMRLETLALPEAESVEAVTASAAVGLFLDRSAAAGAPLDVDAGNAAVLSRIATRLGGLPLALELAAASSRLLPPSALLARLERHAPGGGLRDLPDRQRTITATLDWSHDLLEPEEQDLFSQLAQFAGSFSLTAVEAVAGRDPLPALGGLLDQSLVTRAATIAGEPRFRLLEPVRQYATARAPAPPGVRSKLAEHFRTVALDGRRDLRGAEVTTALDGLEADQANLLAAYRHHLSVGRFGEAADVLWGSWLYLAIRGHALEGLAWTAGLDEDVPPQARAQAAVARSGLLWVTGDIAGMRALADEAVTLARALDDPATGAEAGILAGSAAVFDGEPAAAGPLLERALVDADRAGDRWATAHALIAQGQVGLVTGDLDGARERLVEAERRARAIGNAFTLATALNVRATLTAVEGDHRTTAVLLSESTELSVRGRLNWTLGYSIPGLAAVAAQLDELETAAELFGASASLSADHAVDETFPASRDLSAGGLARVRDRLDEQTFRRHWDAGRLASNSQIAARAAELMQRARG